MAVKKGGLGKGLDSLIPSGAPKNKKNITEEKKQPVKAVEKEVSTITGELPEGAVQFSPVEWNNGQASTIITTAENSKDKECLTFEPSILTVAKSILSASTNLSCNNSSSSI